MQTRTILYRLGVFVACLISYATIAEDASFAQTSEKGVLEKTLNVIVGMPPGGSIDGYSRLVQHHLPHFLPSNPTIVVQNKPGAGSLLSVLAVENSRPSDGLAIGTFSSSLIPDAISDPARFKIDFRHFKFIGNVGEDYRICYVRSETGIKNIRDLASRDQVIFGATAAGTSGNLNVAILKEFLKVKIKQVLGYPGSAAKRLAFERGEIDGDCGGVDVIPEEWVTTNKIRMVVRFLPHLVPGVDKDVEFAGDALSNSDERKVYDFMIMPSRMVGLFMVQDNSPPDKVEVLRRGFDAMVADDAFRADAQRARLPIAAIRGIDVDREIADLYATPPELLQQAKAILKE
jgi:tripartite-type tricarboxylate transporter receptor subunit TctC